MAAGLSFSPALGIPNRSEPAGPIRDHHHTTIPSDPNDDFGVQSETTPALSDLLYSAAGGKPLGHGYPFLIHLYFCSQTLLAADRQAEPSRLACQLLPLLKLFCTTAPCSCYFFLPLGPDGSAWLDGALIEVSGRLCRLRQVAPQQSILFRPTIWLSCDDVTFGRRYGFSTRCPLSTTLPREESTFIFQQGPGLKLSFVTCGWSIRIASGNTVSASR